MTTFVRGDTVNFSAPCLDASGAPITPSSASLNLVFMSVAGQRTKTTAAMTIADNVVSTDWDSSVSAPGIVYWNIKATNSSITIEQDGTVVLTANQANS
jgi:hypothetical protein